MSVSCFQTRLGCAFFFQMYIIFPLYIMIFSISICGVIYEIIPVNVKIVNIFKDKNEKEESADPVDSALPTNSKLIISNVDLDLYVQNLNLGTNMMRKSSLNLPIIILW